MLSAKRKRPSEAEPRSDRESNESVVLSDDGGSEPEIDIFSSLTSARRQPQEENEEEDEDFIRDSIAKKNAKDGTEMLKKIRGKSKMAKGETGGGSFQSMGLQPWILRSLTLKGYRIPTPIQRLSIPSLLASPPRDLVGMARTGSGKTLAYMIPLLQRLGGMHSTVFGSRALILLPTRELALQVMKVGKELARGRHANSGSHAGDSGVGEDAKGQTLRWGLLIGGEGMDEQFEVMASNPDVIIATPGRLLHLIVEANLDLRSVQYVVFDEADRLFEMGFETAMNEILHKLPSTRQTLLFSATLPRTLVEFAKAGLQNPKLVRLDADSKISSDLQMAFFSVKHTEKDACLLSLLRDVIRVPLGSKESKAETKTSGREDRLAPHQTLIFAATKHHVEYLMNLLSTAGYSVAHIYGSLDQHARTSQMDSFRRGLTSILVVTDVAARGIDIPILENVVNYDFPRGARVFVHRVGRTARAGRQGWAWSFVTSGELPFLVDLQLFLGRPLSSGAANSDGQSYTNSLILGPFPRDRIDEELEYVQTLDEKDPNLVTLRAVMTRGHSMYERSQGKASPASYVRAKALSKDEIWGFNTVVSGGRCHPIFAKGKATISSKETVAKSALLQAVSNFRPSETVFEVGSRGKTTGAALMKERRAALSKAQARVVHPSSVAEDVPETYRLQVNDEDSGFQDEMQGVEIFEEDEPQENGASSKSKFKDSEFYLSYTQKEALTDKGYSLKDGASFEEQARGHIFSLGTDEAVAGRQRHHSQLTWDKKKKKFIRGNGDGADNVKMVKTESGTRLPSTYRSGRFEEWQSKHRVSLPKLGEEELPHSGRSSRPRTTGSRRFVHAKVTEPKPLDKQATNYERKLRQQKKKQEAHGVEGASNSRPAGKHGLSKSRYGAKPIGKVKSEIKSVDQIRKTRELQMRKKAKNARPSRKKGKR